MKASKLRKKLLAGVLCVGMLFQNIPSNVWAAEETQTVEAEETESIKDRISDFFKECFSFSADVGSSEENNMNTSSLDYVDMVTAFPDAVFRQKVLDALAENQIITPGGSVTKDDLAQLTIIKFGRNSYDEAAITDISGIELLTGLVSVDLSYNEISDVKLYQSNSGSTGGIDWKALTELESINLDGNEIADLPNFYYNTYIKEVSLNENLLTQSLLTSFVKSNVPASSGVTLADDAVFSQRTNGFKVSYEDTYYRYYDVDKGDYAVPITVMVAGHKSGLDFTISFKLDGKETTAFTKKEIGDKTYENIYWIADAGLDEGTHTVTVTLAQNGKTIGETTKTFTVASQDSYLAKSSYKFSINGTDDVVGIYYPYSVTNTIDSVTLTDTSGKEYTYSDASFFTDVETKDYRYSDIEGNAGLYIRDCYMNYSTFSMKTVYEAVPTGSYDLSVYLKDGTVYCFEGAVYVTSSVTNTWTYSLTRDVLYYNDSERSTATISVTGNSETPKFAIDDTGIATIAVDESDANKAVITAVYGAEGTATVTITVGSARMKAEIEVRRRVFAETLTMDSAVTIKGTRKTAGINVKIGPAEALEIREELEITSSDESVFTVDKQTETDSGVTVTITSTGVGTATLTVKIKDGTLSASCTVTVKEGSFSDEEKATLRRKVGTIYCITNVDGTRLGDLTLPDGWEWISPDVELVVIENDPARTQRCRARYSQEGYASFTMPIPVAVTTITGVMVTGDENITAGQTGTFYAQLSYNGYHVESNASFVAAVDSVASFAWTVSDALTITETGSRSVTVTAADTETTTNGTVSVSVTVGEESYSGNYYMQVLPKHITSITITPTSDKTGNTPLYVAYTYDADESTVYVDEANVSDQHYRIKFDISAMIDDEAVKVEKGTFTWEIPDSDLIRFQDVGSKVYLYIYGSGTFILRATAADDGASYAEIAVEVRDCSPTLESSTIVINKYATDGVQLPLYADEGNAITGLTVAVDGNDNFAISDDFTRLVFKNDTVKAQYTKNTTVNATLTVKTRMGSALEYAVKITVDVTKPTVKLTQTLKPNLFYTNAQAQFTLATEYEITGVAQADADNRETGFNWYSYEEDTGIITLQADGLTASNLSSFKKKTSDACTVSLIVSLDGYEDQTVTVNVASTTKKPSYKIQEIALLEAGTVDTYLIDSSTKKEVSLADTASVKTTTADVSVEKNSANGRISVTYSGTKSKSYKLTVSDTNWTQELTLSGKITVVKSLTTQLTASEVTLNTAHDTENYGKVLLGVSIKNSTMSIDEEVTWEAANTKTQTLLDSGYLEIGYDKDSGLTLGLSGDQPAEIKTGSYKLKVSAKVGGVELTAANLTVSLVSKAPSVKLSGKGSINLINRSKTSVIYTPKLSNLTATLVGVETTGTYKNYFTAELLDDGTVEVAAVEGALLSVASYELPLKLTYQYQYDVPAVLTETVNRKTVEKEAGITLSTSVKVKPANKAPKLTAGKTSGTIYKAANNALTWKVNNQGGFGEISEIALADTTANQYFTLAVEDNQLTLKLADAAKRTVKTGKYTVTYQVKFTDMAYNANPVTMKITVTVK